ncbi:MAG: hypothetical protein KC431_12480 [Myxococcales bacterium]|nr:hypothetical protein [Myxococcales bacterium]
MKTSTSSWVLVGLFLATACTGKGDEDGVDDAGDINDTDDTSGALECSADPQPELIGGVATYEGDMVVFTEVLGEIILRGPEDDPCIDSVSITARNDEVALSLGIDVHGDGSYDFSYAGFGGRFTPDEYGLYPEDEGKFVASWTVEELRDGCALASAGVVGTGGRMYLSGSEDWGPYTLDDVNVSVSGEFETNWYEGTCD